MTLSSLFLNWTRSPQQFMGSSFMGSKFNGKQGQEPEPGLLISSNLCDISGRGSPIARDFTKAIPELLENGELKLLDEDTWLKSNHECSNNATSDGPESLSLKNFMGLYVISGATSTICLLLSFTILLKKFQQHQEACQSNASVAKAMQVFGTGQLE